jgi:hypothetical protein
VVPISFWERKLNSGTRDTASRLSFVGVESPYMPPAAYQQREYPIAEYETTRKISLYKSSALVLTILAIGVVIGVLTVIYIYPPRPIINNYNTTNNYNIHGPVENLNNGERQSYERNLSSQERYVTAIPAPVVSELQPPLWKGEFDTGPAETTRCDHTSSRKGAVCELRFPGYHALLTFTRAFPAAGYSERCFDEGCTSLFSQHEDFCETGCNVSYRDLLNGKTFKVANND